MVDRSQTVKSPFAGPWGMPEGSRIGAAAPAMTAAHIFHIVWKTIYFILWGKQYISYCGENNIFHIVLAIVEYAQAKGFFDKK